MDYPLWNPAIGGGLLIGLVAVAHVVVSHFAIGAGLVLALLETSAVRRSDRELRAFVQRGSRLLILLSTVFGAISGVGIWFTIGLVSPGATSTLIHLFVWAWAIEWVFFLVELAAALAWYATWDRVRARTHLAMIWIYFAAAFLSLVVIQGILAFMLTPGEWLRTRDLADGFFNPTYLPGLVLRTGLCLALAAGWLLLVVQRRRDAAVRGWVVRRLSWFAVAGALVAAAGLLWWQGALPEQVRILYQGEAALLAPLVRTARQLPWAVAGLLLLGLAGALFPRRHRWPAALLLLACAAASLGSYERLREGLRKPFVIRDVLFANGVRVDQLSEINERGLLETSGWAAREAAGDELDQGRAVFRVACAACHTLEGPLSIRRILGGSDPDRVNGVLGLMRADAETWVAATRAGAARPESDRLNYPFMPPLAGTEVEAGALAAYLLHEVGVRVAEGSDGAAPTSRFGLASARPNEGSR